jgi:hypothetical protein
MKIASISCVLYGVQIECSPMICVLYSVSLEGFPLMYVFLTKLLEKKALNEYLWRLKIAAWHSDGLSVMGGKWASQKTCIQPGVSQEDTASDGNKNKTNTHWSQTCRYRCLRTNIKDTNIIPTLYYQHQTYTLDATTIRIITISETLLLLLLQTSMMNS